MVVMPDTGRMGIHDANRMSSIMPVQNAGAEKPIRATMVTRWLVQLVRTPPGLHAEADADEDRRRNTGG